MPKSSQKIGEANFKAAVFQEYFGTKKFAFMQEVDRIDFVITDNTDRHLIWAETKKNTADIVEMFVQLILTIGKGRTFDKYSPPPFLCVFDYKKIAFLQYNAVHDIFYQNDFNWNVAPSDRKSKEFNQIKDIVEKTVEDKKLLFSFDNDKLILKEFIKKNFTTSPDLFPELFARLQIDKNNFIPTYNRWLEMVKPSIAIDWGMAKKRGIIDGDFYLADLLSEENVTLKDKLFVLLKKTNYELDRQIDDMGLFTSKSVSFKDNGLSHRHFWEIYIRPPKEEYWEYIVDRRDLLVPQDIRERKGSFFTPQIWVQKSQEYLTMAFGENWQDEYYVWDCAAGTGNLLVGLTNKYNLWASTIDRQDVDVMKDRIKHGANLLESHVFQFDFLNDSFDKLPEGLKEIIDNPKKRKKLIIYINPPYAEVSSKQITGKVGVNKSKTHSKYGISLGTAGRELFAQFNMRIFSEIQGCKIGEFSTLKILNGPAFENFRFVFKPKLLKCFIMPAFTFDNVNGQFPTGFKIWDTNIIELFNKIEADIYDKDNIFIGKKTFRNLNKKQIINNWISEFKMVNSNPIGYMDGINGNDFQHNSIVYILYSKELCPNPRGIWVTKDNLLQIAIYLSVRHVFEHTWINHNDQFLFPNENYKNDTSFQNDCLVFALFERNKIQSQHGVNHWIPYTAEEVGAKDNFKSSFMNDFIKRKKFSKEAKAVLKSGKELWKYYHSKIAGHRNVPMDASFYDIREFFQGRSESGTMKQKSTDEKYNTLIKNLRQNLSILAEKIKPKVYEYGFLIE
ncbi:MAG: hypothetical protein FWG27_03295 [Treponema sp.]|nr:hypothetical protein [Treponema sp.]